MGGFVKFMGQFGEIEELHVKDGGSWKQADQVWVKDSGAWKIWLGSEGLPAGWSEDAISTAVLHPDGSEYDAGTQSWTWRGAGDDLYSNNDRIVFVGKNQAGDFQLDMYLQTMILEGGNEGDLEQYAGVYLMARETLQKDSKQISIGSNPNANRLLQKRRFNNNATQETTFNTASNLPIYLRLVRIGSNLETFYSTDGSSYTKLGETLAFGTADLLVGVAISSHNDSDPDYLIATGTFTIT